VTISAALAARPLTLDQLAALSDEIAALARAGVPLDRGLIELSRDLPGRVGRLAGELGQRLEAGQPLELAVTERLSASLPPVYRAVIVAGIRSGHLPAALEAAAQTARRVSDARWTSGLSLIYPLFMLMAAWGLFLFAVAKLMPVMAKMMIDVGLPAEQFQATVTQLGATQEWWGNLVPLLAALWLVLAWYRSGRAVGQIALPGWLGCGAIATIRRIQRASRMASLADLLALLVRHEVPLPEAIELATAAVGPKSLAAGGQTLAEQLRHGESIPQPPAGFPPLLAWTITAGQSPAQLSRTLVRTAEIYREEQSRRSQWLAIYVPLVLTLGVGGCVTFVFAALTLGPWILIMYRLAQPV
jgi:general secretion pathway protein F